MISKNILISLSDNNNNNKSNNNNNNNNNSNNNPIFIQKEDYDSVMESTEEIFHSFYGNMFKTAIKPFPLLLRICKIMLIPPSNNNNNKRNNNNNNKNNNNNNNKNNLRQK